jgi:acetyltransferase-like isoleucine patch superfamily enzyme
MNRPNLKQIGIRDVTFGVDVTVVEPCNLYGCIIGDGSFIGPFVEVQRQVRIGARTRIQSHSFVCELTEIGDDCFIGHGVMFVNDLLREGPAYGHPERWAGARLEDHVSIGSNATILPVRICARAVIGAGAVVTHDIIEPGIYAGVPARKLRGT